MDILKKLHLFSSSISDEAIGIEFNANTFKVAHLALHGSKCEVLGCTSHGVENLSDEEIARLLRQAVGECKAKNPFIADILPANMVITKNIEIPSTNPHEIKEIINLQAGRHTPYSREEIIVDYINIGTYRRSYTKILLIIVARNIVKRQFLIMEKAGVAAQKVFLASEGIAASLSALLKEDTAVLPACVIHIDEAATDFIVIFKNKPIFVRSISIGAGHFMAERDRYQERFIEEIKGSLEAYQNEDIERVPKSVIITGATAELQYLEAGIQEALRLPAGIVPYLKNAVLSPAALNVTSSSKKVSFFNLITSLYAAHSLNVSLIPEEVKLRRAIEQRGRDLIKTGIFVLLVFLFLFLILLSKIHFKSSYLEHLNSEGKILSVEARALQKDLAKVNTIKSYMTKRGVSLEALTALYELIPLDTELSDIRYDELGKFTLRGTSASMSSVFAFVDSMNKSEYFSNVKTKYTTKRKEGLKDVTDFEINCLLNTRSKSHEAAKN